MTQVNTFRSLSRGNQWLFVAQLLSGITSLAFVIGTTLRLVEISKDLPNQPLQPNSGVSNGSPNNNAKNYFGVS